MNFRRRGTGKSDTMLKAVIFDIDDTLYSYRDANDYAMPAVVSYAERELGVEGAVFLSQYQRAMEEQLSAHSATAGCHSRAIRFQMTLEAMGLPLYHAAVLNDLYWNTFLEVIRPFPEVVAFMSALKSRGIRLGVGSDMTADWQLKKLHQLGLLELLDFVVTSEEAGVEKPESGLFSLCAKKAGCAPEECLFIGDNLKKDVQGARNAGMHALWYQPDVAAAAEEPNVRSTPTYKGLIDHINQL